LQPVQHPIARPKTCTKTPHKPASCDKPQVSGRLTCTNLSPSLHAVAEPALGCHLRPTPGDNPQVTARQSCTEMPPTFDRAGTDTAAGLQFCPRSLQSGDPVLRPPPARRLSEPAETCPGPPPHRQAWPADRGVFDM